MDAVMLVELGDFSVRLPPGWTRHRQLHPASIGFSRNDAPLELVLTAERVSNEVRTREEVVETYARGRLLAGRRSALAPMGAGEISDDDVVGPVRFESKDDLIGARQWAHMGDRSMVVAVFAAELVPDAFSCLAISTLYNEAVDMDLAVERVTSEVIAAIELRPNGVDG